MKIRILQTIAGERFVLRAGEVFDLPGPDHELMVFVDGVRAELVREPQEPELATVGVRERAVARKRVRG